ncbi:MAG: hypothetical protein WDO13_02680 [Verrucomicrobiota bacterium]
MSASSATISPRSTATLFAKRGIDLDGLEIASGKTFCWSGEYEQNMNNRKTLSVELNVFETFEPKLPEHYRETPYVLLGNIAPLAAAPRGGAGAAAEVRRGRHDGPVDRPGAARPARPAARRRHAHSQRQRGAPADRGGQPHPRRPRHREARAAVRRGEEGRARLPALRPRRGILQHGAFPLETIHDPHRRGRFLRRRVHRAPSRPPTTRRLRT